MALTIVLSYFKEVQMWLKNNGLPLFKCLLIVEKLVATANQNQLYKANAVE